MGSVPNCQKEIPARHAIRWFKCKLKPPKKSMYNIYTAAGLLWRDGLAQSPSEAVPFNLWEGPGVRYSLDGQSVAFWEEVFLKSLCLLIVP